MKLVVWLSVLMLVCGGVYYKNLYVVCSQQSRVETKEIERETEMGRKKIPVIALGVKCEM